MSSVWVLHPSVARQALLIEDKKKVLKSIFVARRILGVKQPWRKKTTNVTVFSRRKRSLTCFLGADRELFAWKASTYLVVGVHADAVNTSWVQLYDVGLVVGGRDVSGCVHVIPGICRTYLRSFRTCISYTIRHRLHIYCIYVKPTWLVLILYVIAGDDAVSIEPLDPAKVHAPVLHLPHFQFRGIWWFCMFVWEREKTREEVRAFPQQYLPKFLIDLIQWHSPTGLHVHIYSIMRPCASVNWRRLCTVCAEDTLHSELDEPSALSIGVDGVAGEKDRISSLGWVQLWSSTQRDKGCNVPPRFPLNKSYFDHNCTWNANQCLTLSVEMTSSPFLLMAME